jgi:murein L,D-transpeptidase YafK
MVAERAPGALGMDLTILGMMIRAWTRRTLAAGAALLIAGCAANIGLDLAPHMRPISKDTMMLLGKKGMSPASPLYVRIFKEESELEVWKQRDDGRYYHFKTYPICNYSGDLGPKQKIGDKQSPEGFYAVPRHQMNPNSQFHLAFNLGFPNAYDKAHNRTGDFLMVHGKCKSAGCYAMTDALIEEIYALARESFIGGQDTIAVHAFPYRMTDANLARHKTNAHYAFWTTLKQGYDYFETSRQVPPVVVCNKQYVVAHKPRVENVQFDAEGPCPAMDRIPPEKFSPKPSQQASADDRVMALGPKMRSATATPNMSLVPAMSLGSWFK